MSAAVTPSKSPLPESGTVPAADVVHDVADASEEGARTDSSAPRKRKKLRKEEIVVEATCLFAERGYEGTSMGDLAERVGLRKASLFHHFPSKDVLYATVLSQLLDSVKSAILRAATAEGSYAERLDALNDALVTTLGAHPHTARLLLREALDWGPIMREHIGDAVNEVLAAALEFARAGQREGILDPNIDAMHLVVTLIGVHFVPFAVSEVVQRFTGSSPFNPAFIAARSIAVKQQVRALTMPKG